MAKPTPTKKPRRPIVVYEPKGYEPKRIYQKIASEDLFENLKLDPAYLPWLFIDNIIQRVFARMVGQGPTGPVVVRCTKEGSLSVVQRGGAFDDYERQDYTYTVINEVKEFTFSRQVERIDLFTYNGKVDYELSRDLVKAYGAKIPLFEDSFYSLDFYTQRVRGTCISFAPATPTRTTLFGWFRAEG